MEKITKEVQQLKELLACLRLENEFLKSHLEQLKLVKKQRQKQRQKTQKK